MPCGSICIEGPSKTTIARLVRGHAESGAPGRSPDVAAIVLGGLAIFDAADITVGVVDVPGASRGGDASMLRRAAGEALPMTPARSRPLRQVLEMHRAVWDRDDTRSSVREAFAKVVDCGTEALGAEVFASDTEERVVYHTCKSRALSQLRASGHQSMAARPVARTARRAVRPRLPHHAGCALAAVPTEPTSPPRPARPGRAGATAVGARAEIRDPTDHCGHPAHLLVGA